MIRIIKFLFTLNKDYLIDSLRCYCGQEKSRKFMWQDSFPIVKGHDSGDCCPRVYREGEWR